MLNWGQFGDVPGSFGRNILALFGSKLVISPTKSVKGVMVPRREWAQDGTEKVVGWYLMVMTKDVFTENEFTINGMRYICAETWEDMITGWSRTTAIMQGD